MTRLHLVVHGRVQGVGFRWFVRETARELGVGGWVRNRSDGAVEVAAEGDAGALQSLRAALGRGPAGASVAGLEEVAPTAEPLDRPFTILREP